MSDPGCKKKELFSESKQPYDGSKEPHEQDKNSARSSENYGWFWLRFLAVDVQQTHRLKLAKLATYGPK